jgi:hypothetical protein
MDNGFNGQLIILRNSMKNTFIRLAFLFVASLLLCDCSRNETLSSLRHEICVGQDRAETVRIVDSFVKRNASVSKYEKDETLVIADERGYQLPQLIIKFKDGRVDSARIKDSGSD